MLKRSNGSMIESPTGMYSTNAMRKSAPNTDCSRNVRRTLDDDTFHGSKRLRVG